MRTFSANVSGRPSRSRAIATRSANACVRGFDERDGRGGADGVRHVARTPAFSENSISKVVRSAGIAVLRVQDRRAVGVARDAASDQQQRSPGSVSSRRAVAASATSAVIVWCTVPSATPRNGQQVVERRVLDVGARELRAEIAARPTRRRARTARRRRGSVARRAARRHPIAGGSARRGRRGRRRRTRTRGSCGPASRPRLRPRLRPS